MLQDIQQSEGFSSGKVLEMWCFRQDESCAAGSLSLSYAGRPDIHAKVLWVLVEVQQIFVFTSCLSYLDKRHLGFRPHGQFQLCLQWEAIGKPGPQKKKNPSIKRTACPTEEKAFSKIQSSTIETSQRVFQVKYLSWSVCPFCTEE